MALDRDLEQTAGRPGSQTRTGQVARPLIPSTPVDVPVEYGSRAYEIVTDHLLLRPLHETDRDGFVAALAETREQLDASFPLHEPGWTDEDVFERYLTWTLAGLEQGVSVRRAMLDQSGHFVGMVNVIQIERGLDSRCELSFWTRASKARQGLTSEALAATVEDCYSDLPAGLGMHSISAWVQPSNQPCVRLMNRLGFRSDGQQPQRMETAGRWMLHQRYSMAIDFWSQLRSAG